MKHGEQEKEKGSWSSDEPPSSGCASCFLRRIKESYTERKLGVILLLETVTSKHLEREQKSNGLEYFVLSED